MGKGKAYLVGAGPGDVGLITIKGIECIRSADVIIYDNLVNKELLKSAKDSAELIYVGKSPSSYTLPQNKINDLLEKKVKRGKIVVRLKGGDPFVFGRGSEEAELLANKNIEFEIVPGITSAIAVPAYAGIPVTDRRYSSSLAIITGHEDTKKTSSSIAWDKISKGADTLIFLMGMENLSFIVQKLIENGRDEKTPVALIRYGTTSEQEVLIGTLKTIVEKSESAGFKPPVIIIVGKVVNLREKLRWFDNKPLFGKKVVVTRSREQASELTKLLKKQGAEVLEFPVIKIIPVSDTKLLDREIKNINKYDWLIFTSVNGVKVFIDRLYALNLNNKKIKICAVGPRTAEELKKHNFVASVIPEKFVSEEIIKKFSKMKIKDKKILLLRAGLARDILIKELKKMRAKVKSIIAYNTTIDSSHKEEIINLLKEKKIDYITFTSSSTVKNFVELIGKKNSVSLLKDTKIAVIGPIAANTAKDFDIPVDVIAEEYTIQGLVNAMIKKEKNKI